MSVIDVAAFGLRIWSYLLVPSSLLQWHYLLACLPSASACLPICYCPGWMAFGIVQVCDGWMVAMAPLVVQMSRFPLYFTTVLCILGRCSWSWRAVRGREICTPCNTKARRPVALGFFFFPLLLLSSLASMPRETASG